MGKKYNIAYNDIQNVAHQIEIYDDAYVGSVIDIDGYAFLDYSETDDPLECVRGHGLRVQLDADTTQDFSDLYAEDQMTFPVIYKRNSVTLFSGWLNSEGWYEDFVNDKWQVSFDCIDGLGYLKDLSWVDDATGLNFVGTFSQLELLSKALIRTGLQQNINVDIQIFYTGLSETGCVLSSVKARATRYIKDDKNTVMSCDDVIRDVLEPYGACIVSKGGEWFIFKPNQLFASATLTYHRFDYLGAALAPTTATLDTSFALGSDVDGYAPHHCSGNQRISFVPSLGAYRINYKYGEAKGLLGNDYFAGTDPLDDWVTNSTTVPITTPLSNPTALTFDDPGITLTGFLEVANGPTRTKMLTSELVGLTADELLTYKIQVNCTLPVGAGWEMDWVFRMYSTDAGGGNPIYSQGSVWGSATPYDITTVFTGGLVIIEQTLVALPQAGKLFIEIWSAETKDSGGVPPIAFKLEIIQFNVSVSEVIDPIEGEFHTVQRIKSASFTPSANIKDIKEVFTGDSASDLYVGTLYKADGNTPTISWFRSGITEAKPILQIMGEETLRLNASTSRLFYGGVFGYFSYLSRVTINGVSGIYMATKYSYDTQLGIINAELMQIYGDELDDQDEPDFYQLTYDRGEVVTPTIIG